MQSAERNKYSWRVPIAVVTAFTLVFAAISSNASMAFADDGESKAKLKALPKKSLVDDGNSQLLELKFKLEEGTIFEFVRITIDPGTPDEEVVEFDSEGNPLPPFDPLQPPFELIFGQITMLSDGYYAIGKAKGKFVIAMNKTDLGAGEHEALAEVVLGGGEDPLTATAKFLLKPSVPLLPDLVAKLFFAPSTIKKPLHYMTFTIETNEGFANAKEHKVAVYLSDDNTLGGNDEQIGKGNNDKLEAGWFDVIPVKIKVPKDEDTGPHYLFVKVDSTDKIQEISEDNNINSKATTITAY
jgi:hypothetical protein